MPGGFLPTLHPVDQRLECRVNRSETAMNRTADGVLDEQSTSASALNAPTNRLLLSQWVIGITCRVQRQDRDLDVSRELLLLIEGVSKRSTGDAALPDGQVRSRSVP